jgi:signal transduction histidine kinase
METSSSRRIKALMWTACVALTVLLLGLQLLDHLDSRATQRRIRLVHDDALTSVHLVGRLSDDILRERILIDRHIFEHEALDMKQVEQQIAAVRKDYADAATQYSRLADFPGEAEAWRQLQADVATVEKSVAPALDVSSQNRDAEAIELVVALDPRFERIGRDVTRLIGINESAAAQAVAEMTEMHRAGVHLRIAFTSAILALVVVGGVWMTSTIVRAQEHLVATNLELADKNRELDAFAGRVAHDLRGPLATLSLATSLLDHVPEARKRTATLSRGIAQISNLIEDLLLLSRAGALAGATTRIEPVAATLHDDLLRLIGQAGGTLTIALGPAAVTCSEGLLRQVLWNLGENAVKYRRLDVAPALAIVGKIEGDRYSIRVSDNGLGMSAEDARRAFEPFYRSRATSTLQGTGLGLAIVRRVVEASGGKILVDSTPGQGSTFVMWLPLAVSSEESRRG